MRRLHRQALAVIAAGALAAGLAAATTAPASALTSSSSHTTVTRAPSGKWEVIRDGVRYFVNRKPTFGHDAQGRPTVTYAVPSFAIQVHPHSTTGRLTIAEALSNYTGYTNSVVGPGPNTGYGRGVLTFYHPAGHPYKYSGRITVTYVSPYVTYRQRYCVVCWFDPSTWLWRKMINAASPVAFYDNFIVPCWNGMFPAGLYGSYGGSLMTHILFWESTVEWDVMDVTPQGLAQTSILACSFGILKHLP